MANPPPVMSAEPTVLPAIMNRTTAMARKTVGVSFIVDAYFDFRFL